MHKKQLEKFMIDVRSTIRQAMESINENWREVTLVKADDGRIVGTITDGDIRRGLLHRLTLESPAVEVMNPRFVSVSPEVGRAAVLDMMKALVLRQMPILDPQGRLVGIHFLNDLLGAETKPNMAVIMAGGKGTRLKPLTESCPKPMIQVAGRPILERVVLHLVSYGIRKIFISVNYLSDRIESYFGDGSRFGCAIEYLREKEALGTGGPLSLLPSLPDHPIIVMNGDLITQANIEKALRFHEAEGVAATICIRPHRTDIPYALVKYEGRRLVELSEKPSMLFPINAGIYILDPHILSFIPSGREFPIVELFQLLLKKREHVAVYHVEEEWVDVGNFDDLRKANGILLEADT